MRIFILLIGVAFLSGCSWYNFVFESSEKDMPDLPAQSLESKPKPEAEPTLVTEKKPEPKAESNPEQALKTQTEAESQTLVAAMPVQKQPSAVEIEQTLNQKAEIKKPKPEENKIEVSKVEQVEPQVVELPVKENSKAQAISKKSVDDVELQTRLTQETTKTKANEKPIYKKFGSFSGSIYLQNASGKTASPEGAIINLIKLDEVNNQQTPKTHIVDMQDKTYKPGYLAIHKGDKLLFKNGDPLKHNVFSSSGENSFDLGTYGFRREKAQQFNQEGIVKVYCNIHPEMALFVSVTEQATSFVTDETGKYLFEKLTPGRYLMKVWHVRGSLEKKIEITENQRTVEDIKIDTTAYTPKPHLNKFGKEYKKIPPIFKDEFY